jgi:hypothetical protein
VKVWGINRKARQEPTGEGPLFNKIFFYVLDRMAVEVPELYLVPDHRGGMQHGVMIDKGQRIPFVTVGQELLQGHMEKDLAFMVARELTYMRPNITAQARFRSANCAGAQRIHALVNAPFRCLTSRSASADGGPTGLCIDPGLQGNSVGLTQMMAATAIFQRGQFHPRCGNDLAPCRTALVQDLDVA